MTTIPSAMRASVLVGKQTIEMQERPVPSPAPDEVLVQVRSVGVCGSDKLAAPAAALRTD